MFKYCCKHVHLEIKYRVDKLLKQKDIIDIYLKNQDKQN